MTKPHSIMALPHLALPDDFYLTRYRLTLEAEQPIHLQPVKGSALRGGFGRVFKRLTCPTYADCRDSKYCQRDNRCPYGYIFETSPPTNAEALRSFSDVPRPFIIEAPVDGRQRVQPGELLTFDLILVGRANTYQDQFEAAFADLGQSEGLGKTRACYRLRAMSAVGAATGKSLMAQAGQLSARQISLTLATPTRLKHQGRWVQQGPSFQALVKTLLGRLSSLCYLHCGVRLEADFRALIDAAATVETVQATTRWEDWDRFSGRQKQRVSLGGLVGEITYQGNLAPYHPLLAAGVWTHVGKGTVFGNGQYNIRR